MIKKKDILSLIGGVLIPLASFIIGQMLGKEQQKELGDFIDKRSESAAEKAVSKLLKK